MSETATERLRELLDERGVEWEDDTPVLSMKPWKTSFTSFTGEEVSIGCYDEPKWIMGTLVFHTPEQAIEATIGRGKCHTVSMDCFGNPPYNKTGLNGNSTACGCSECGAPWSTCGMFRGNKLNHNFKACPICGREVEQ